MFAPASTFKRVDTDKMLKQIESDEQYEKNAAANNAERAEYERLKRKFW